MNPPPHVAIWWIKRDARLLDNPALCAATSNGGLILPLAIIEPSILKSADYSRTHLNPYLAAISRLRESLRSKGVSLCLAYGEVEEVLEGLRGMMAIRALFSTEETGSAATFARDLRFGQWCKARGLPWFELPQQGVFRRLKDRDTRMKRQKAWMDSPILATPYLPPLPDSLRQWCEEHTEPLLARLAARSSQAALQGATETDAHETLRSFLHERGKGYSGGISSPLTAFTAGSRLSPHLAWGTVSSRVVLHHTTQRLRELEGSSFSLASKENLQWRR